MRKMRTLQQVRKSYKKAQKSSMGVEMMFAEQPEIARRKLDRAYGANKRLSIAEKRVATNSRFKTFLDAKKAVIAERKARKEFDTFVESIGGIKIPYDVYRIRNDAKNFPKYQEFERKWEKAKRLVDLARVKYPKA
ncbi:MAG: hypothetical protein NTY48_02810 [Candidatus Diapherotrites archaeon]|nr:hypothetical protein [Candidatus Diapherotrites archaeon]